MEKSKKIQDRTLTDTFTDFKENKNIDPATMQGVLEDVLSNALIKKFDTDENFDIIVNIERGDIEIWRNRVVVADEDFEDEATEIPLSEALKIDDDYEVEEEVVDEFKLEEFGRRSILAIRQNLTSRIMEIEKDSIFQQYSEQIGNVITGDVYQIWSREILVMDDDQNELILPKKEQIPTDKFHKGDTVRAVVVRVEMKNNNPLIVLSRTSPIFLERLFEFEVPEIQDGLIIIHKIVREPGERAKVAVESYDERIDPVGACVGMNGNRIRGIVRELNNENIDVVNYTENRDLYITRALSPAKIKTMKVNVDNKRAEVFLDPDQVSKAIGKGGLNIKLAGELTGYEIDVYRDTEEDDEDVSVDEFSDEIDGWVLDALKAIGCDTAKSVLRLTPEELERRTDLEEETVERIYKIFSAEFE